MVFPKVLCSLTTFSPKGFSWQSKIEELSLLRLEEFALFLTGLKGRERYVLYEELLLLKQEYQFEIPFVHATNEMSDDDYYFLIDNFGTKAFNIHPTKDFPLAFPLSEMNRSKIFIENATQNDGSLLESDLIGFAGICFDLSHCEDEILMDPNKYKAFRDLTYKSKVGANHISSVPLTSTGTKVYNSISQHFFSNLEGFQYIQGYPPEFFGEYCAIELEDPIHIQLKVNDYVEELLRDHIFVQTERKVA